MANVPNNEHTKLLEQLNQLKQRMKSNLELIALKKFPNKIEQFRQERKTLTKDILTVKGSEFACTIPVPDSLHQNWEKLENKPNTIKDLLELNPNLQCQELVRIPVLVKNAQMPTNGAIVGLITKILPYLYDLDEDLNKLDYALRLFLPRMREGEYLGTELLQEVNERIQTLQSYVQGKIRTLNKYHYTRTELLQNVICYGHVEDYRVRLVRLDRRYCHFLLQSVDLIYKTYVIVYDLIKKNYDKLSEFKSMADFDTNKEMDCLYC
ncbi:Proteasome activator complex subunit 3 [Blomia tropicalis]|nr:Proteasome activator complex subunit 3 [Blomia tropicalis]